jgi:hypothetical protein
MLTANDLEYRKFLNEQGYWEIPEGLDTSSFDFNWRPFCYEKPYIHQFGTQWQKTGGPKFIVPKNEGVKFQDCQRAIKLPIETNRCWRQLLPDATIDYSWHPDETDPPYIYVFGNQWYDCELMPTFQYRVKGATEKKFMYDVTATLLPNLERWEIPNNIDTKNFDFSWIPHPHEPPMHWQFGTQWQKTGGPKYKCENALGIKYINDQKCVALERPNDRAWRQLKANIKFDFSWHPDDTELPYIYVFGNQWYDAKTMPTLLYRVKGATEKKYINDVIVELLPNRDNWQIPELIDDSDFDYSWVPSPFEPALDYQFGTQWQKTGGPKYVVPNSLGVKYIDFQKVKKLPDPANRCWRPLIADAEIDKSWHPDDTEPPYTYVFGNQWYDSKTMPTFQYHMKGATQKKYIDNLRAILTKKENRAWRPLKPFLDIDTSWVPHPHDPPYIYVFGNQWDSSIEMPTAQYKVEGATQLKYSEVPAVKFRVDVVPLVDSIFDAIIDANTETDYIQIGEGQIDHTLYMPKRDSHIHIIDEMNAIVPKEAKTYMYDNILDYPHIKYHSTGRKHRPLDIIFLSNGEEKSEENYEHLLSLVKGLSNNIIGLKNIKGRVQSQHEAAKLANTPWYFLINGKCKVNENFDFDWQPDRKLKARHYIFRATNPVNELEYGHMAIVANNKKLTLATTGKGLDFTLESPHQVVNINSGIGMFNTSKWDTWRTAFREVIKLKHNVETINDSASKERLDVWTTIAKGDFAEWSIKGANDAVNYYNEVNGDFDKLKLSYDWEWLYTKFNSYRS